MVKGLEVHMAKILIIALFHLNHIETSETIPSPFLESLLLGQLTVGGGGVFKAGGEQLETIKSVPKRLDPKCWKELGSLGCVAWLR